MKTKRKKETKPIKIIHKWQNNFHDYYHNNRKEIGKESLQQLVIPGTHDSGSYLANDTNSPVANWVVCQDEDVLTQLLYGIRFV